MPTPDNNAHAYINSVLIGSRHVRLRSYGDLLASAPRKGRNRPRALSNEVRFYPRFGGEKFCQLGIQIDGHWTEDNTERVGSVNDWADAAETTLVELAADDSEGGILGVGLATVTFEFHHHTGIRSGTCQVEGVFNPIHENSYIINATLELSVTASLLTVPGS